MCMKISSTMTHFFIGNYLNFYYTGIPFPVRRGLSELNTTHGISSSSQQLSQWMISQNVHFPSTKFQNGTTSLQISYTLEGACTWFVLPTQQQQWLEILQAFRKQRLRQKSNVINHWNKTIVISHCNKQMESKYVLERNKLQERNSMTEIWNNWYRSKFLQVGRMTKVSSVCLKCRNRHADLVHTIAVVLRGQIILKIISFTTSERSYCWISWADVYWG